MYSRLILFIITMPKTSHILLMFIAVISNISALNVVKEFDTVKEQDVNIPGDIKVDLSEHVLDESSDGIFIDNKIPELKVQADSEIVETAESGNYVYRPLYVYRKIEHSKKRINMYNAFAG